MSALGSNSGYAFFRLRVFGVDQKTSGPEGLLSDPTRVLHRGYQLLLSGRRV